VNSPKVAEDVEVLPVRVRAYDGYELGGVLYTAGSAPDPRQVAVLHAGAGIPAVRYRRFARFLAGQGIPTLTYDYRGIGVSRPATLRGFPATIEDWAFYDCAGGIAWLREHFPRAAIVGIAHSIGALLFGGAHNAADQSQLVIISGHTAYYGDYHTRYRLPMTLLWHALMPLTTALVGYFPARRLGLGEDIPAKVALRWAKRRFPELRPARNEPHYERFQMLLDRCASLQRPALLVSISDDAFATANGTKRLMTYYPRLFPLQRLLFTPAEAGVRRIGHFGFFARRAGTALWPRLLARLEAKPA
jgi:predicted alpha/beta hydrolase